MALQSRYSLLGYSIHPFQVLYIQDNEGITLISQRVLKIKKD